MGFETVANLGEDKDWANCKYVRYTTPTDEDGEVRELKDKEYKIKKDEALTGYYLRSYERDAGQFGKKWNHVLVDKDNTHWVIPDNKDVTRAFQGENIVAGALTRFTYLGKKSFEYTDDKGKVGTAKAVKALIEQDKSDTVTFEGAEGCEYITGSKPVQTGSHPTTSNVTADQIPF